MNSFRQWIVLWFCGFIVILGCSLSVTSLHADTTEIKIQLSRFGDMAIHESSNPANNIDRSLMNLAPAMGEMQYRLDPLSMLVGVIINTDHPEILNRAALEAFLNNTPQKYQAIAGGLFPQTQRVDSDGTIETPVLGSTTIEDIENFTRWFGIREWADAELAAMDPVNRHIVERWIEGAQKAARDTEASFYAANPELQGTNIVQSFYNLSLIDFIRAYAWVAQGYDYTALMGIMGGVAGWLRSHTLGVEIPEQLSQASLSGPLKLPRYTDARNAAIGASNGAAITYIPIDAPNERRCVAMGEPHQPSSYDFIGGGRQQMKLFGGYASREDGKLVPFFLSGYPTLPAYIGLQFTPHSATTGTADPIASSMIFLTETDGERYFDGTSWHEFLTSSLQITRNGVPTEINRFEVPDFGRVFALIQHPDTGKYYTLSMRQKSPSSFLDGFWSRLRAGLKNDGDAYLDALEKSVPHYGEAGCAPSRASDPGNAKRMAYFAMNQGKVDQVPVPTDVQPFFINFPTPNLKKIGILPQAMCTGQYYATSDNGSLSGGCHTTPSLAPYLDAGHQTFRQLYFKNWAESNYNTPTAKSDVLNFATSTESILVKRVIDIVVESVERFGDQVVPVEIAPLLNTVKDMLALSDGSVRDNLDQLLIYYLYSELRLPIITGNIPMAQPSRDYLIFTHVTKSEMANSLTLASATTIIQKLIEGVDFVASKCLPEGLQSYSDAISINISGAQVASEFAGPGYDSRSNAVLDWVTDGNGKTCSLRILASSPLKFVATEDEVYFLPFGPSVSTLSTESGVYDISNQSWGEYWSLHNRDGSGYGRIDSYRKFALTTISGPPPIDPEATETITISVSSASPTPTPAPSSTPGPSPSPSDTPTSRPSPSSTPSGSPGEGEDLAAQNFRSALSNLDRLIKKIRFTSTTQKIQRVHKKLRGEIRLALSVFEGAASTYASSLEPDETASHIRALSKKITSIVNSLVKGQGKVLRKRKQFNRIAKNLLELSESS